MARLQPCLDEAYQIMIFIQDKLKGLQQMHWTMRLVVEGPTTEKLVEEVRQAAAESSVEVAVIQVELADLCSKIAVLVE